MGPVTFFKNLHNLTNIFQKLDNSTNIYTKDSMRYPKELKIKKSNIPYFAKLMRI